ncbi:MAG: glycosyltransferase 61 family protein [Oscillospiraceae bacterium]
MYNLDLRYLRPKKAAALKRWHEGNLEVRETLEVWKGENATLLPVRKDSQLQFGRGGVVDKDGNYIDLSCIPQRVQYAYDFQNPEYRDQKVVYCGYMVNHWGHFLIEGVCRLWYFLEQDPTIDKYVFLLDENEEREIRGNYREFLQLLKIWDKLEFINKPTTFREVLVPELALKCHTYYCPKLREMFDVVADNVVVDPSWKTYDKIFYSRSQLAKGIPFEFGFDMLDSFFAQNGYTILYPEKVPLGEMIHYIRNSKVVASISGSLPHNMFFGRNGQKVEIIERCTINDDNQVDVNRIRELHVVPIDANIPVYPINFVGPFIMGYTPEMQRFAVDNGYTAPNAKYLSEKHYKKCFVRYMKAYKDLYRYNWFMYDWYDQFTDTMIEAFQAGHKYFGDYLDGKRPFLWHHYFELHYLKQFIKRLLKRG